VSWAATPGRGDQGDEYANNLKQTASFPSFKRTSARGKR
jgi:hypothetical protein